jgi:hypothetical protein
MKGQKKGIEVEKKRLPFSPGGSLRSSFLEHKSVGVSDHNVNNSCCL